MHSCGTVYPHGAVELAQPETGLYLAGMKSYGRAPSFLALTGFEQTRSIVAAVAGDHEAAARVELVLPESGVCGGSGLFDGQPTEENGGACCAPAQPELVTIGAPAQPTEPAVTAAPPADDLGPHRVTRSSPGVCSSTPSPCWRTRSETATRRR